MRNLYIILQLIVYMSLLSSCNDDSIKTPTVDFLNLNDNTITISSKSRYYVLDVNCSAKNKLSQLKVESDQSWCHCPDTVAYDGIVELDIDRNDDSSKRTAKLTVYFPDSQIAATVHIVQNGDSDTDENNSDLDCFHIGYGYNVFDEYNSDKSVQQSIIDLRKIIENTNPTVCNMLQYATRSKETATNIVANSILQMQSIMEKQFNETSQKIGGSKKTIDRLISQDSYSEEANNYCYIKIARSCASAAIDISTIYYCLDKGIDIFTDSFNRIYKQIKANPNNTELIETLLNNYGTHLVTSSELGGMMDLTLNFTRVMKGELQMRAEDFSNYIFNKSNSEYLNDNGQIDGLSSDISGNGCFNVSGGDPTINNRIRTSLKDEKKINKQDMIDWQRSIEGNPFKDVSKLRNLVPVNFSMIPIWELLPASAQTNILNCVLDRSKRSNNSISNQKLGTDIYRFDLTDSQIMNFDDSQTLVRVIYAGNPQSPCLEVCNEYVPKIRSDHRITVVYAIQNGRTFHGAGLFPGDGEGNPPAFITFSDGECYVNPIKGKKGTDILQDVYYIHGHIYDTDLGLDLKYADQINIVDQYLKLKGSSSSYPIVKIGSGYWTRRNICENMEFGINEGRNFTERQRYVADLNNMLFAYIFDNSYSYLNMQVGIYGKSMNKVYGERTLWYVPLVQDKENLTQYLGINHKSLFKGQVSGFDAEFVGYATTTYVDSQPERIDTDNAYIGFINSMESVQKGEALILKPDYTWSSSSITGTNKLFPIRLFRTSYFEYK